MNEPWQVYREELLERAEDVPDQVFDRSADMSEAAHEAYEATVDRLVNQLDYAETDALALVRSFGEAVKRWTEEGEFDWDDLTEELMARQSAWEGSTR